MKRVSARQRVLTECLRYLRQYALAANMKAHFKFCPVCSKCKQGMGLQEANLDHIHGRHPVKNYGYRLLPIVDPTNLQILCTTCNCGPEGVHHKDYRTEMERADMKNLEAKIWMLLEFPGANRPDDILQAIKKAVKIEQV